MGDNVGINRVPTNEERQDYSQLGETTPKMMFLKELAKVEMVFVKGHKPFDAQCARIDFVDRLENIQKESERKFGFVRQSDVLGLKFNDLDKYGDANRFELESDDEVLEFQNINQTRTATVTGHNMSYRCKDRGHGISVFVPLEMWEELFGKKTKIKKEE